MRLEITNFKGIKGTNIFEAEHFNMFNTKNGTGKSSLLEAVKFALTGITPDDPIYKGEKSAKVSLEVDGTIIDRKLTLKEGVCAQTVKVNGESTSQKALKEFMEQKYGANYLDVYKLVFNPTKIKSMDVNEITSLLTKIIPSVASSHQVLEQITENDLTENERFTLMSDLKETVSLDDVSVLSEKYTEMLRKVKLELKTLESVLSQTPIAPAMSYEDCEAALAQIATYERDKVIYEKAVRNYNDIIAKNDEIRKKLDSLAEEIKSLPSEEPNRVEGSNILRKIDEINAAIQSNIASSSVIGNNITVNKGMMDKLNTNVCPLSDKLTCMTDKTELKTELGILITANEAELERLLKERTELEAKLELLKIQYEKFRKDTVDYQTFITRQREIETLNNAFISLPEKPSDKQFGDYSERKSELEAIKNTWIAIREADTTKKRIEKLKSNKDGLSHLADATKEKGCVRRIIMSIAIDPINHAMNEIAHKYNPDFNISFEQDNGVRIKCQTGKDRPILHISSLSAGEKNIFAFFVIDMICSFMDIKKVLIMDAMDDLDDENFQNMLNILKATNYEYIFVARCR